MANEAKEKWIYAFKLSPNEFAPLPESVTASPFAKASGSGWWCCARQRVCGCQETQRVRGGDEGGFKRWAEPLEDTRRDKRPATANGDIYVKARLPRGEAILTLTCEVVHSGVRAAGFVLSHPLPTTI